MGTVEAFLERTTITETGYWIQLPMLYYVFHSFLTRFLIFLEQFSEVYV